MEKLTQWSSDGRGDGTGGRELLLAAHLASLHLHHALPVHTGHACSLLSKLRVLRGNELDLTAEGEVSGLPGPTAHARGRRLVLHVQPA